MKIKICNWLIIFGLLISGVLLPAPKGNPESNVNSKTGSIKKPQKALPKEHQIFDYSQDIVTYKKVVTSNLEDYLLETYMSSPTPGQAVFIFDKTLGVIYLHRRIITELIGNNQAISKVRSNHHYLKYNLFEGFNVDVGPLDKKVLWANAFVYLAICDCKKVAELIRHTVFFAKTVMRTINLAITNMRIHQPKALESGYIEAMLSNMLADTLAGKGEAYSQEQIARVGLAMLARDYLKNKPELEKNPEKHKQAILELTERVSAFWDSIWQSWEDSEREKDSITLKTIFKNVIRENKQITRALPIEVCTKIKELCKNEMAVDKLTPEKIDSFACWVCQEAAKELSVDLSLP